MRGQRQEHRIITRFGPRPSNLELLPGVRASFLQQFNEEPLGCEHPGDPASLEGSGGFWPFGDRGPARVHRGQLRVEVIYLVAHVMQSASGNAQEPAYGCILASGLYQLDLRISCTKTQKCNSDVLQRISNNSLIPDCTWEGADEARHGRRNVGYDETHVVKTKVAGFRWRRGHALTALET